MFPVFFWQLKGPIIGNQFILISVFEKILHLICLLCSQRKLYNAEAVTRSVRQPNCFMSSVVRLPPSIHSNVTIIFSKGSFLFLLKLRDGSLENSHGTSLIWWIRSTNVLFTSHDLLDMGQPPRNQMWDTLLITRAAFADFLSAKAAAQFSSYVKLFLKFLVKKSRPLFQEASILLS